MANAWIIPPLPMTAVSAPTSAGAAAYLANDYRGMVWEVGGDLGGPTDGGYFMSVDVDLGSDRTVDTMLLLGLAGLIAGTQCYVFAATEAQGAAFTTNYWRSPNLLPYASAEALVNGDGMFLWSAPDDGTPPLPARYWRIAWITPARVSIRARRIVLGERIVLERNFSFGRAVGVRPFGATDFSARGVLLRRRAPTLRTTGLTFASTSRDEIEAKVLPLLERFNVTDPVALITDPAPHSMRTRRTFFGPLIGDLGAIQRNAAGWQWQANLVSLI
ncbi:hypothetical protein [Sphingomonas profundi]|uniref:hypothetical protein n=1 Tax=Alterirhizorhabdus profundi TaxID=2681549 RepID=UPI0012E83B89|nr:hypothetical protein [Sphingomonas profundi]